MAKSDHTPNKAMTRLSSWTAEWVNKARADFDSTDSSFNKAVRKWIDGQKRNPAVMYIKSGNEVIWDRKYGN